MRQKEAYSNLSKGWQLAEGLCGRCLKFIQSFFNDYRNVFTMSFFKKLFPMISMLSSLRFLSVITLENQVMTNRGVEKGNDSRTIYIVYVLITHCHHIFSNHARVEKLFFPFHFISPIGLSYLRTVMTVVTSKNGSGIIDKKTLKSVITSDDKSDDKLWPHTLTPCFDWSA